ncbi:MAG: PilX N-terminal domain-containing pilus assembly protein [Pseudomonadales bacterium]
MRRMNHLNRSRESGAVLIVAMIILVILTLLGITAMNTTSLQERMASNTQEQVHAFQAAETGLNQAFADNLAYDISSTYTGGATPTVFAGSADSASYISTFLGFSPPPPGSLYSATSFQAAHFNFRATGTSATNLSIVLNGGAYQIAPKQ